MGYRLRASIEGVVMVVVVLDVVRSKLVVLAVSISLHPDSFCTSISPAVGVRVGPPFV